MTKEETYEALNQAGIVYEITEHKPVFNMEDLADVPMPYPEGDAKNLFIRDDRHRHYYLLTVRGDRRVDLKAFRKNYGTGPLTFASAEEMKEILGLTPGAVTPLGLLNDRAHRAALYLDRALLPGMIGVHPNENTATVWMRTEALVSFLRAQGAEVNEME